MFLEGTERERLLKMGLQSSEQRHLMLSFWLNYKTSHKVYNLKQEILTDVIWMSLLTILNQYGMVSD